MKLKLSYQLSTGEVILEWIPKANQAMTLGYNRASGSIVCGFFEQECVL